MRIFITLLFSLIGFGFLNAQTTKVAILDFENTSGKTEYDALGKAISSMLITDLANNIHPKKVEFFERSQLNKLLDEQKLQKSKNFDAKTAVDFGKLSGVNYVFLGSVFVLDGTCNFSSKLVDVQTSKILLAKDVSGKIEAWLQLKTQLSEAIANQLNNPITIDPLYKDQSTSLSTINQYGKILTTMDQGDMDKAEQLRSVFQETTPNFKYFIDIKDEIERLKQRVSELENVTDILTDNFDLGDKAEMKKDFKSAVKYFEKFINNPGNQGHVENKKLYAYGKLARCQFLTGDYTNALINSRLAQLIYKFYPEANEIELMSMTKLNLSNEVEEKYNFILDSLTFRNEQNFRRQERNSLLNWKSIDGVYFGMLPQVNSEAWIYLSIRNTGYGSTVVNEVQIKKILKENSLSLLKSKNQLSQYEKIESKLLAFNDSLIFSSDQILNFYNLSLQYADDLNTIGDEERYKLHLKKEIIRMEHFGVTCSSWYEYLPSRCDRMRIPLGPNQDKIKHKKWEETREILWGMDLSNSIQEFDDNFHLVYGQFLYLYLIKLLNENQIKDAALVYKKISTTSVKERDSYFYNYYWDIILKLRVITEDFNTRSPLSKKEFEKRLDDRIRQLLKDSGLNQDLLKKLKEEKIEFKSGSTDIEIDTTQNEGKLIWSKNLGLITDAKGNIIRYCNIDSLEQFNQKNIPAYTFYDGDISNGEKYGKLYNYWALELLIQNPPIGWRVAKMDDFIWGQILKGDFYNCYEAEQEYLKKYPDVKEYALGPTNHYEFFGKKEGRVWNSKICLDDFLENCRIQGLYGYTAAGYSQEGGFISIDGTARFWIADKIVDSENSQTILLNENYCLQTQNAYNGYYSIIMVKTD